VAVPWGPEVFVMMRATRALSGNGPFLALFQESAFLSMQVAHTARPRRHSLYKRGVVLPARYPDRQILGDRAGGAGLLHHDVVRHRRRHPGAGRIKPLKAFGNCPSRAFELAMRRSNDREGRPTMKHDRMAVLNAMVEQAMVPVFFHPNTEVCIQVIQACANGGA